MGCFCHRYITRLYRIPAVYSLKINHTAHLLVQPTAPNVLELASEHWYRWIDDDKTPLVVYVWSLCGTTVMIYLVLKSKKYAPALESNFVWRECEIVGSQMSNFQELQYEKHVLLFEWFANVCCLKGGSCDGEPTVKIRHFNFQHFPVSLVRIYSKHSQH